MIPVSFFHRSVTRKISSLKLELQNFFEGFINQSNFSTFHLNAISFYKNCNAIGDYLALLKYYNFLSLVLLKLGCIRIVHHTNLKVTVFLVKIEQPKEVEELLCMYIIPFLLKKRGDLSLNSDICE